MKRITRGLLTLLAAAGPIVFLCLLLSPRLVESLSVAMDDLTPVEAQVTSCAPYRNGRRAQTEVVCRFTFFFAGAQHTAESRGWSRDDPFLTFDGLADAVGAQLASTPRTAYLHRNDPRTATLSDPRWVVAPPLWVLLLGVDVACIAVMIRADPSHVPHRRDDLATDPATGHLVAINHYRRDRIRRRLVAQGLAALLVGVVCAYGLSNRPANVVARLAMTALQPVPAQLVDCGHRYQRTGRSGFDRLDCDVVYTVADTRHRGTADFLRFGLFPTDARMDAEVAKLEASPAITAYVDPRYPSFAWAFLREDAFVPFTWGLFELQLILLALAMAGVIAATVVRWHRADRA